jgi:hypothetical protein
MNKQEIQERYTKTLADWRYALRHCAEPETITRLEGKLDGLRARLLSFDAGEATQEIAPVTGSVKVIEIGDES